jgi:hypothetical protein
MRKVMIPSYVRKEVFERAMAKGHCECEAINHDHDPNECQRKPSHLVLKHNGLETNPKDFMVVCSRCRTLFRLERG